MPWHLAVVVDGIVLGGCYDDVHALYGFICFFCFFLYGLQGLSGLATLFPRVLRFNIVYGLNGL